MLRLWKASDDRVLFVPALAESLQKRPSRSIDRAMRRQGFSEDWLLLYAIITIRPASWPNLEQSFLYKLIMEAGRKRNTRT
jgi:hypothetical protein